MKEKLEHKYKIKTQLLGPGKEHQQEVRILNRGIGWNDFKGIVFEAHPRHAEIIIEQLKLQGAKLVTTPGTKDEGITTTDHNQELNEQEASLYRALTARCNHISPDRPDISYTVKELARSMSKPTRGDWQRLKRLG